MRIIDLIIKKRDGGILTKKETSFLIESYTNGSMPDYQMSAFAMATFFNEMNQEEIVNFTDGLLNSGETINLDEIKTMKVDKHSTGGVGDKTTLALGPIISSFGISIAKMSGRGLGHTGGTLDKLEAIPGFNVNLTTEKFIEQVNAINFAVMGQTQKLVPADKKLYSLRDVTGTTMIIGLIASSIMSKKLAINNDLIVLDIKCGDGAFLKNINTAKKLAKIMIEIGKSYNRKVVALITNMDQPLGNAIGNTNEVQEAIKTLEGKGPKDFTELVTTIAALILVKANKASDLQDGLKKVTCSIESGKALEQFNKFVKYQNGDISKMIFSPKYKHYINSEKNGFMNIVSSLIFGITSMKLGSGRLKYTDSIDYNAGINLNKKTGDKVLIGENLLTLFSDSPISEELINEVKKGFEIISSKNKTKVIYEIID